MNNLLSLVAEIQQLVERNNDLEKENARLLLIEEEYQKFLIETRKHGEIMFNNVLKLCLNGVESFKEEWQPDWSNIKYDHLRMDGNGGWNSFNVDTIHYDDEEWMFNGYELENGDDFNKESHITYKHPNPSCSIYTRPGILK
jgi:hypothetical protein